MIECVMAGRIMPAFTMSATPGLRLKVRTWLDTATLSATALALTLWVATPPGPLSASAFGLAAELHLLRQAGWRPWVTRDRPILWVLHTAYAWIAGGFALLALAQIGALSASAGVHALAVGATGGLIAGMITRTARGHSGRPLKASGPEALAYVTVMVAAVLRDQQDFIALNADLAVAGRSSRSESRLSRKQTSGRPFATSGLNSSAEGFFRRPCEQSRVRPQAFPTSVSASGADFFGKPDFEGGSGSSAVRSPSNGR